MKLFPNFNKKSRRWYVKLDCTCVLLLPDKSFHGVCLGFPEEWLEYDRIRDPRDEEVVDMAYPVCCKEQNTFIIL